MARRSNNVTMPAAPAPLWRFVGTRDRQGRPTEFFDGIPARDLTERDFDRLDDERQTIVRASRLYEQIDPPEIILMVEPKED